MIISPSIADDSLKDIELRFSAHLASNKQLVYNQVIFLVFVRINSADS